jgi:protocatechuate 3,4-dioxygenase alpha subunit
MGSTPSQTIGPFFHLCLPRDEIRRPAGPAAKGEHIRLLCRVLDGDGVPVNDALIELWQADAAGIYDHPADSRRASHDPAVSGFARLATNENGECVFYTVKPGKTSGLDAPHINVSVFARGLLKRAATRIYFSGDPSNDHDPVLQSVPAGRRGTLIARRSEGSAWTFEIHLSGDQETVFFDI